jgi:hypothetical protein
MPKKDGCTGKKKHKTKITAIIVAKKIKNKGLNVYHCEKCGFWHLGNSANSLRHLDRLNQLFAKLHKEVQ